MNDLSQFEQNLNFEYVKTFSGLDDDKLQAFKAESMERIKREAIEKGSNEEEVKEKLNNLSNIVNARSLFEIDGTVHSTTVEKSQFQKSDAFVINLLKILSRKVIDPVYMRCLPTYRDAIVFYTDQDEINDILYICFSCMSLMDKNHKSIPGDLETYYGIKELFQNSTHSL